MKKPIYILLFLIAAMPTLLSCNDEDTADEKKKKMSGTWQLIWSEGRDSTGPEELVWEGPASGLYWTLNYKDNTGNDHTEEDGLGENYDWVYEDDYLTKYNLTTGYRESFYIEKLSPASLTATSETEDGTYFCRMMFTKISKY